MTTETIAIASDHAGYTLKTEIGRELVALGFQVLDLGTNSEESVDYPDFARALAEAIGQKKAKRGVLVCGSGIGISMAANRFPGIRAAPCHSEATARLSRQHNDANVLALGSRLTDMETAKQCLKVFLTTEFEGGRHARRVDKLDSMAGEDRN